MAKQRIIKYYRGPSFIAADWTARNPYLEAGEVGYELSGGKTVAMKVGPGLWNDLDYLGGEIYDYVEAVTNEIGDAKGVLNGLTTKEILNKMLNPYQVPAFSNISNNAGVGYLNIAYKEIGQTINGPVTLLYSISNAGNLSGATPINVEAGGIFANETDFANSGSIALSLNSPLSPSVPTTITITLKATHAQGQTSGLNATSKIIFNPKIIWVSNAAENVADGASFMALPGKSTILSSDFLLEYSFTGIGYAWIAIPAMLSPSNLLFMDVMNPYLPSQVDMVDKGTLSINNGVGTYSYQLFRSSFYLLNPIKLKIVQVP